MMTGDGPNEWITIYTDASFSPGNPPSAGWGVWARISNDFLIAHAPCPDWIRTSAEAEAFAIVRGLAAALEAWRGVGASGITLKSDCQGVLPWFNRGPSGDGSPRSRIVTEYRQLAQHANVGVRLAWVKGHQRGDNVRGVVNNKADKYAARGKRGQTSRWLASCDGRLYPPEPEPRVEPVDDSDVAFAESLYAAGDLG